MKYIITDNIRVANVDPESPSRKRPLDCIGKSIWIKMDLGEMHKATIANATWAAQGIVVFTVDELGEYFTFLTKEILKVAAATKPERINDVKIYWRG